ncbi:MAG: hypothetical protein ABR566_17075, partial [Pyrinomonadaceae bacterium]
IMLGRAANGKLRRRTKGTRFDIASGIVTGSNIKSCTLLFKKGKTPVLSAERGAREYENDTD